LEYIPVLSQAAGRFLQVVAYCYQEQSKFMTLLQQPSDNLAFEGNGTINKNT
jgi:hypothetical protein